MFSGLTSATAAAPSEVHSADVVEQLRIILSKRTFRCPQRFVCAECLSYSSMVHEGLFFLSSIASSMPMSPYNGLFFMTEDMDGGGPSGRTAFSPPNPLARGEEMLFSLCWEIRK